MGGDRAAYEGAAVPGRHGHTVVANVALDNRFPACISSVLTWLAASAHAHPYVRHQTGANARVGKLATRTFATKPAQTPAPEAYPRTSSTKGAETPACEGPGRRLKAAVLSPN
jgi:hypothetical protein